MGKVTAASVNNQLRSLANDDHAAKSARFFKTGPGEYSADDKFLGIRVPELRSVEKSVRGKLNAVDMEILLQSQWHEIRLFALFAMVSHYQRGDDNDKSTVVSIFFKLKKHINNWDLVDSSAQHISGAWHFDRSRRRLDKLIVAKSVWDRRIAIMSTFYYIHQHDLDDTFRYAEHCLDDTEDLIYKATGWMLREAGKRDEKRLLNFIKRHGKAMPRTMLRYAIEKLPDTKRKKILTSTLAK